MIIATQSQLGEDATTLHDVYRFKTYTQKTNGYTGYEF